MGRHLSPSSTPLEEPIAKERVATAQRLMAEGKPVAHVALRLVENL